TQELPGRRARAADVAAIPTLVLDVAGRATPRPASGRNPITFGGTRASEPVGAAAIADGLARAEAPRQEPALAPGPRWSLAGMATDAAAGLTAVLSGPGGVHLVKAGDRLPDGAEVIEIADDRVTLRGADGDTRVLRLP
ncbi:MAG: hypothetical protein AB7O28_19040, partial [Vicinamibacterales bacterium]